MTNLTREDMLRELELLPVWQSRDASPVKNLSVTKPAPVIPDQQPQAEVVQEVEAALEPAVIAPVVKEALVVEMTEKVAVVAEAEAGVEPTKVAKPWVLVYSTLESQKQEGIALMRNIVKAMRLPQGEFEVLDSSEALQQYSPEKLVVFGQANMYVLNAVAQDLEALRGKANALGDAKCWVTYGIDDMLGNPALKAQVWHDLQAALAFE